MKLDKFFSFYFQNMNTIIEVLFVFVALLMLFLAVRAFLKDGESDTVSHSRDLSQIEASLKKIIEQSGQLPRASLESLANGEISPEQIAEAQEVKKQVEELRSQLEVKAKQIKELEVAKEAAVAKANTPAAGGSSDELDKLKEKLKELESKLSEYEIISEDIADLSFYKEENQKLKSELDELKKKASSSPAPAAAPAPAVAQAPTAAPAPQAQSAEPQIAGKSKVEEPAAKTEPAGGDYVDDDLMKEFAAAVENQKTNKGAPAQATPKPAEASAPEPKMEESIAAPTEAAADATTETAAVSSDDQKKSENLANVESSQTASEASGIEAALGQVDLDKMANEASNIQTSGTEPETNIALEENLNEDKLLQEAGQLNVTPEDASMMGQFEDFVKKG